MHTNADCSGAGLYHGSELPMPAYRGAVDRAVQRNHPKPVPVGNSSSPDGADALAYRSGMAVEGAAEPMVWGSGAILSEMRGAAPP
jgi:hypothetical protein